MKRIVLLTVGKTHAGKSTFANRLAKSSPSFLVIDQDVHARFLNNQYAKLLPLNGPNILKHEVTETIIEHARLQYDGHLVVCNANLTREGRSRFFNQFPSEQFRRILVHFDIAEEVLLTRATASTKDRTEIRGSEDYRQILSRQRLERPEPDEDDLLLRIRTEADMDDLLIEKDWLTK